VNFGDCLMPGRRTLRIDRSKEGRPGQRPTIGAQTPGKQQGRKGTRRGDFWALTPEERARANAYIASHEPPGLRQAKTKKRSFGKPRKRRGL